MARSGGPATCMPVLVKVPPWQGQMNLSFLSIQPTAQPKWGHTEERTFSLPLSPGTTYTPFCTAELRQPSVLSTLIVRTAGPVSETNSSIFPTSDQDVSSSRTRRGKVAKRTSGKAKVALTRPPTETNKARRNDRRSAAEAVTSSETRAGVDIELLLGSKTGSRRFGLNFRVEDCLSSRSSKART